MSKPKIMHAASFLKTRLSCNPSRRISVQQPLPGAQPPQRGRCAPPRGWNWYHKSSHFISHRGSFIQAWNYPVSQMLHSLLSSERKELCSNCSVSVTKIFCKLYQTCSAKELRTPVSPGLRLTYLATTSAVLTGRWYVSNSSFIHDPQGITAVIYYSLN